jgi:hypothetical protein
MRYSRAVVLSGPTRSARPRLAASTLRVRLAPAARLYRRSAAARYRFRPPRSHSLIRSTAAASGTSPSRCVVPRLVRCPRLVGMSVLIALLTLPHGSAVLLIGLLVETSPGAVYALLPGTVRPPPPLRCASRVAPVPRSSATAGPLYQCLVRGIRLLPLVASSAVSATFP